jgi:hypothetical protein
LVTKKGNEPADSNNTKTLTVGIMPQGPSYATIEAYDEEPGRQIFTFMQSSNEFILTGKTKGQTYLHIKHTQVAEDLRVLVYAADTIEELNTMFPIALNKTNYMLTIGGEHQFIQLTTPNDDPAKLAKITWSPNNTGIINTGSTNNPKQREIWAKDTVGNCWYDIKYNNELVEKAFISVKSAGTRDMTKRIITENIIGMTPGQTNRLTSIGSNLTGDEIASLEWRSSNNSIVTLTPVPGNNGSRYLTAGSAGEAEVVVSLGQIERYIKVYVHAAPDQYKAVNLDNRYFMLRKNDEITIQSFHAALGCTEDDQWDFYPQNDPFDNRVIEKESVGKDKLKIKGINEGIATLVLHNNNKAYGSTAMSDITFMVEVNNTAPLVEAVVDDWYMTAVKTVYALDQTKVMDITRLSVMPIRFPSEEAAKITWKIYSEEINGVIKVLDKETPTLIDLYNKTGTFADLSPKGKKGTAVIRAYHPRSVNSIDFTVICDEAAAAVQELPYITTDVDIVKMKLSEIAEVTLDIKNIFRSWDIREFTAVSDNEKISVSCTGNKLSIRGEQFGQALVTIRHPAADNAKKIIVMVMSDTNSLVYLTTRQNFVMVERNGYVIVEVNMVGFQDINNSNYHWETTDDDIISINASGKSAVVSSKNVTKTATIKVWNDLCKEYYLTIYVRVTDALAANPVYITTNNNIISVKEGNSIQVKANLVNGGGHELFQFRWSTADSTLIELNYSGDTAMIKGLKAGTAGITISHDSSLNAITILAVIEPQVPNNGIYIATDTTLVEMSINESQRLIKARLVGGEPEDVYGFQWSITHFLSQVRRNDGSSYQVINITSNADQCYIYPYTASDGRKYEGEAIITISHPKTSYKLDIKVLLQDNTELRFAENYTTMNQFTQKNISVSAPSNGLIFYDVDKPDIVEVTGTNKQVSLNALKAGTVVVTVYNQTGNKSDEMIVRVNPADNTTYYYLWADTSLLNFTVGGNSQTVRVYVKRAADNTVDEAKTGNIKFRIKPSYASLNCIKLNNVSVNDWQSNANGTITIYPQTNPGDVEIEYKYEDSTDPNYTQCPNLKDVTKTIFIRVNLSDFSWACSNHDYIMVKNTTQEVWARIDGVTGNMDYSEKGDITWESKDSNVAIVAWSGIQTFSDNTRACKATITAVSKGTTGIKAAYKGYNFEFPIIVNEHIYLTTTQSGVQVMPSTPISEVAAYFKLESNKPDSQISFTVDNLGACSFFMANATENTPGDIEIRAADSRNGGTVIFRSLASGFTCGEYGMWIKVIGNVDEGISNIIFTMKDENCNARVSVTNLKNEFVRWKTQAEARFAPNQPDNSYKIYYNISPSNDTISLNQDHPPNSGSAQSFTIGYDEDEGGRYIYFKRVNANYFMSGNWELEFITTNTNKTLRLPVYIGYPNIDVTWESNKATDFSFIAGMSFSGKLSEYDQPTYAFKVAQGERIVVRINPVSAPNSDIVINTATFVSLNISQNENSISVSSNTTSFSLERKNEPNRTGSAQIDGVKYIGIVEVTYSYSNQTKVKKTDTRRFIIYAMDVK